MLELSCDSEEYDTIYFYFSGHGFQNRDNELCIMTRDFRLSPYPMMYTKVGDIAKFIKSTYDYKYIIFILDMCQTYRNDAKSALDIEFPYGIITICSCLPDSEPYLLPEGEERWSLSKKFQPPAIAGGLFVSDIPFFGSTKNSMSETGPCPNNYKKG